MQQAQGAGFEVDPDSTFQLAAQGKCPPQSLSLFVSVASSPVFLGHVATPGPVITGATQSSAVHCGRTQLSPARMEHAFSRPCAGCSLRMSSCNAIVVAEALKLTPAQQYVKKLATKWLCTGLTSHGGGAVIAGLDTSTGRALAVQMNDPSFVSKLDADLSRLQRQLGINEDQGDWKPDSSEYQVSVCASQWALAAIHLWHN